MTETRETKKRLPSPARSQEPPEEAPSHGEQTDGSNQDIRDSDCLPVPDVIREQERTDQGYPERRKVS